MLETRFKVVFLIVVLLFAAMPIIAILRGTTTTPFEETELGAQVSVLPGDMPAVTETPLDEEMVLIPAGIFLRGTDAGGLDEGPPREIFLDAFRIDRYEVTNSQYGQFAAATGHRKAGPPSRYAKNVSKMRGGFPQKQNGKRLCGVLTAACGLGEIQNSLMGQTGRESTTDSRRVPLRDHSRQT
jgi:formylglycine-generating enzyme required for sulfatase activity